MEFVKKFGQAIIIVLLLGVIGLQYFQYKPIQSTLAFYVKNRFSSETCCIKENEPAAFIINENVYVSKKRQNKERDSLIAWYRVNGWIPAHLSKEAVTKKFSEDLLNQYLIMIKAQNEPFFQSYEFNQYLWMSLKSSVVRYYLGRITEKQIAKSKVWKPDRKMVDEIYRKNVELYKALKLDRKHAGKVITEEVQRQYRTAYLKKLEEKIINTLRLNYTIE